MYPERRYRSRPRLQALEARHCPSCLVYQDGATLYVVGDGDANVITLAEDHRAPDVVHVTCDGRTMDFAGVRKVVASTGEGDDFLSVLLGGPDTVPPDLRADLGGGNDTFTATFNPTESVIPAPPGISVPGIPTWKCDVTAGPGDDSLAALIGNPDETPEPHLINANATLNFDAGAGGDTVGIIIICMPLAGSLKIDVATGDGEDSTALMLAESEIRGSVSASINTGGEDDAVGIVVADSQLLGPVDLRVFTRGGNDVAAVAVQGGVIRGPLSLSLDTGLGDDLASVMIQDEENSPAPFVGSVDVAVNTGAGNDRASIMFQDEEDFPSRLVESIRLSLDTGLGDDIASVLIQDSEDFPNPLSVDVATGGGDDMALIFATNPSNGSFDVKTGGGNDTVLARIGFNPQPDPPGSPLNLSLLIDAGADDDDVDVMIDLGGVPGIGSQAQERGGLVGVPGIGLQARVLGREGDDHLELEVFGVGNPNDVHALVDGGPGFDQACVTRGVLVRNCEDVEVMG
jgi:hypothetical protein